jgi:hypothetical protein
MADVIVAQICVEIPLRSCILRDRQTVKMPLIRSQKNTPSIAEGLDGDEFGIVGALARD